MATIEIKTEKLLPDGCLNATKDTLQFDGRETDHCHLKLSSGRP